MERILAFLYCFFFFLSGALAQVEIAEDIHDFGLLRRADQNWHDFAITNRGQSDAVIFRVEGPKSVQVKMSAKIIAPDSTVLIRVQYNPPASGKFKVDMDLYISAWQSARKLRLTGESTFASSGDIPCPDFSETGQAKSRALNVSVRDMNTNVPFEAALVQVFKDGRKVTDFYTDENGELSASLPVGRYFLSIKAGGAEVDTALYVSPVNDHLLVMMDQKIALPAAPIPPPRPVVPAKPVEQTKGAESIDVSPVKATVAESIPPARTVPEEVAEDEGSVLSSRLYKQNNVVFLVDVSTSMKHMGRMDLLKIAMIDLLGVMRPTDRFTLISYASQTNLIIETTDNLDKESCARAIAALEAGGNTAGAKAIDAAGNKAVRFFLPEGNNQIILATDGSFNEGHDQALKLASRYKRKGVHTSVLGIKCGKYTTTAMTELAEVGGGRFIPIESTNDAGQRLINEIKTSSKK
jgi:Ca-activated chloride channel family protein